LSEKRTHKPQAKQADEHEVQFSQVLCRTFDQLNSTDKKGSAASSQREEQAAASIIATKNTSFLRALIQA